MGFWLQLGVCGFRMDAVPFLIGRKESRPSAQDYEFLHEMRDFLQWRRRDILLAEANVPPDESSRCWRARRCLMMLVSR